MFLCEHVIYPDIAMEKAPAVLQIRERNCTHRLKALLIFNGDPVTVSETATAIFVYKKPDGTKMDYAATLEDGFVWVDLHLSVVDTAGEVETQFDVYDEGVKQFSTPVQRLLIGKDLYDEETMEEIVSDPTIFEQIVGDYGEWKQYMDDLKDAVERGDFNGADGPKGDKGDKGDPGEAPDMSTYASKTYVDAAVEDKAVYIVTGNLDLQTLEITNLSDSFRDALTKDRVMLRLTYYLANRTRRTVDCPLIFRMSGMSVNNSLTFAAVFQNIPGYAADAPTLLRIGWGGAGETISANLIPLATASVLSALLAGKQDKLTFDGTPTAGSTNPVTSAGIKRYVDNCEQRLSDEIRDLSDDKQDKLTFDTHPTTGSENPVKSYGIKTYVDTAIQQDSDAMRDYVDSYKQNKLTFDIRPRANSTNPVTSDGIRSYVQDAVGGMVFGNGVSSIQKAYAEEPASPQEGDAWYDTTGTDPLIRFYDGTDWDEGDTPDDMTLYVLI